MEHEPFLITHAANTRHLLQSHAPLVHCMTNDVVQAFSANVLLAIGASPAMVVEECEAAQFSALADALLINVGTLTLERSRAMRAAIHSANTAATPWVLDPVAVGNLTFRTDFTHDILTRYPAVVRGNASEILSLAGERIGGRGVDSTEDALAALPAAKALAKRYGTIVAVTGEVDYLTDGERTFSISGGHVLMTRVAGTGCALSAILAACCALPGDTLGHVAAGCAIVAHAGEQAVKCSAGPGSFIPAFIDALWQSQTKVQP